MIGYENHLEGYAFIGLVVVADFWRSPQQKTNDRKITAGLTVHIWYAILSSPNEFYMLQQPLQCGQHHPGEAAIVQLMRVTVNPWIFF